MDRTISHVTVPTLGGSIPADLVLVLALFACLGWAARRGLLAARETAWIGGALVFFGVSLVFNAVLARNAQIYPHQIAKIVGLSALMVLPLLLALGYGVYALARSLRPKTLQTVQIGGLSLHLVQGPLAAFTADPPLDAVFVPTATDLALRGEAATGLRASGGPAVDTEARSLAPVAIGKAVSAGAGSLSAAQLIYAPVHAPGQPVTEPSAKRALDAAFQCARQGKARRVALPPFGISPGKLSPAESVSLTTAAAVRARKDFDLIAIVVSDPRTARTFQSEFKRLAEQHPASPAA